MNRSNNRDYSIFSELPFHTSTLGPSFVYLDIVEYLKNKICIKLIAQLERQMCNLSCVQYIHRLQLPRKSSVSLLMPRKWCIPVIRWIARARVPMPSSKDYIARPAWQTDVDVDPKKKKTVSFMVTKGSVRRFYMGVHWTVSSSGIRVSKTALIFPIIVAATVVLMVKRRGPAATRYCN